MKRHILCLLLLLCILSVCIGCQDNSTGRHENTGSDSPQSEQVVTDDGRIEIAYRVCDTGGGRLEGWVSQHGTPGEQAGVPVRAIPALGYTFTGWSDGIADAERHDIFGSQDQTVTANFSFDRRELPIMSVTTVTGKDVTSKENYIGATVSLCNTGNTKYEMSGISAGIRGRGNATWTYEKKSYRIRFEQKQQPLGLGSAPDRTWVLMANHCDQSLMRNALAIDLANRLDGIDFNSSSAHVELYLNGEYRGVYLLVEQIQVDAARVDIGEEEPGYDPMAVDAGFLVELDSYSEPPYEFRIHDKRYQVKSEVRSDEQFDYIRDYIAAVDDAVRSGSKEQLEALVDLDSFIDGYLLEEYLKNIDVGWSSFYMYKKPGGKMILGPFWDFDLAAGNDHRLDNGSSDGLYAGRYRRGFDQYHPWFTALTQHDWFAEAVVSRWQQIGVYLDENIAFLDSMTAAAPQAFNRNFEKWHIFGQRINQEPEHIMALDSWEEHADALRNWLMDRRAWLDECLSSTGSFSSAAQSQFGRH